MTTMAMRVRLRLDIARALLAPEVIYRRHVPSPCREGNGSSRLYRLAGLHSTCGCDLTVTWHACYCRLQRFGISSASTRRSPLQRHAAMRTVGCRPLAQGAGGLGVHTVRRV